MSLFDQSYNKAIKMFQGKAAEDFSQQENEAFFESILECNLKRIDEGLIYSFDVFLLRDKILEEFEGFVESLAVIGPFEQNYETAFGKQGSLSIVFKEGYDKEKFQQILNVFGYFVAKSNKENHVQLEPKFTMEVKNLTKNMRFFHITLKSKLKKILEKGLLQKDSQTTYQHPAERIYFIATNVAEKGVKAIGEMLAKNKQKKLEDFCAVEILFSLEDNERKFFIDESFNHFENLLYSMFTTQSIEKKLLKVFSENL